MDELVLIKAPWGKTARGTRETLPTTNVPGQPFKIKKVRVGFELLPEIQAWVDDGRIVKHEIARTWTMGTPRLNSFWFSDPKAAMLFKLTYG